MCEQFSFCDVISYSPNNTLLNSIQELKNYLTSKGACICGLKLSFSVEEVFSFDPKVIGLQEQLDEEELRQHIYRQPTLIEPTSDGQKKVIGHVPMDSDSYHMMQLLSPLVQGQQARLKMTYLSLQK